MITQTRSPIEAPSAFKPSAPSLPVRYTLKGEEVVAEFGHFELPRGALRGRPLPSHQDGGSLPEFSHVVDALAQLAQKSNEMHVIALRQDLR